MQLRSIRFTLTWWYVGILAAILSAFGWLLYTRVASSLIQDVDDVLVTQADGVAEAISAFWDAQQDLGAPVVGRHALSEGVLRELIGRWARETGELETIRPVRLLSHRGESLAASPAADPLEWPGGSRLIEQAERGRTVYETLTAPGRHLRVLTRPVLDGGRFLYIIQVAAPLQVVDGSLAGLRWWLLGSIPAMLVLTSAGGWFLASTALHPVGRMVEQVRRIGAAHLHQRVDVPSTGDELEQLATTFNDMLQRLERAFRQLRKFSAAASHELRTPLTVMKGELEVALRKPRDTDEYQRVLRAHLEALNEMATIVEELLALARTEVGEGAVEWKPVELGEVLRTVQVALQPLAEAKAIRVHVRADQSVWVRGERRLLERLATNLLDNAIRHTPQRGAVTLRTKQQAGQGLLIVQDTGPGIPAEELPHLFDRFFSRQRSNDERRPSGLGLGLCRWIAEAHQGHIEVDSQPGGGATFTLWLPTTEHFDASLLR